MVLAHGWSASGYRESVQSDIDLSQPILITITSLTAASLYHCNFASSLSVLLCILGMPRTLHHVTLLQRDAHLYLSSWFEGRRH